MYRYHFVPKYTHFVLNVYIQTVLISRDSVVHRDLSDVHKVSILSVAIIVPRGERGRQIPVDRVRHSSPPYHHGRACFPSNAGNGNRNGNNDSDDNNKDKPLSITYVRTCTRMVCQTKLRPARSLSRCIIHIKYHRPFFSSRFFFPLVMFCLNSINSGFFFCVFGIFLVAMVSAVFFPQIYQVRYMSHTPTGQTARPSLRPPAPYFRTSGSS